MSEGASTVDEKQNLSVNFGFESRQVGTVRVSDAHKDGQLTQVRFPINSPLICKQVRYTGSPSARANRQKGQGSGEEVQINHRKALGTRLLRRL